MGVNKRKIISFRGEPIARYYFLHTRAHQNPPTIFLSYIEGKKPYYFHHAIPQKQKLAKEVYD